jgi:peptidyl-prolyl cis-trans isomerase A (cyclophilin A)
MVQVGINGNPATTKSYQEKRLIDEETKVSNKRGMITFAHAGKNTRSTQIFINLVNNAYLDDQGFAPFAEVIQGMDHIDALYMDYGEGGNGSGKDGKGPNQGRIVREGNAYLNQLFPKLSYIISAEVI